MRKFLIFHLPAILYAALIIVLSSIPILGKPPIDIWKFDKMIHFVEYAIFAILVFRSISNISPKLNAGHTIVLSLILVGMFAFVDEYYQSYIPGRHSDPFDWLFDFLGAALIILYMQYRKKKRIGKSVSD